MILSEFEETRQDMGGVPTLAHARRGIMAARSVRRLKRKRLLPLVPADQDVVVAVGAGGGAFC